jgi:hypothetical protein
MGAILGALFRALLEAVGNVLVGILSKPDTVKADPKPILDRVVDPDPEDLMERFAGVL